MDKISEKVIVSSRVRLARNITDYPFPNRLSSEDSAVLAESLRKIFSKSKKYEVLDIDKNTKIENNSLVEEHLISPEFLKNKLKKYVVLNNEKTLSIMINEEDHIRIQAITSGGDMELAYNIANKADDFIEKNFDIAFDETYGFLTSCPTNVGTGLRVSYMIHVPILELTGQITNIKSAISKLGLTVRGMYGEGTEAEGGLYQVSNQITLGQSEKEIMRNLHEILVQIIEKEIDMRNKLVSAEKIRVKDEVHRAYGTLTNAQIISAKEAVLLLSYLKLGIDLELINHEVLKNINIYKLMEKIQKNNLQKFMGKKLKDVNIDIERANLIKTELLSV